MRAENIGRRAPVDLGVVGDVRATLDALLPLLKEKRDARASRRRRASTTQRRAKALDELARRHARQAA